MAPVGELQIEHWQRALGLFVGPIEDAARHAIAHDIVREFPPQPAAAAQAGGADRRDLQRVRPRVAARAKARPQPADDVEALARWLKSLPRPVGVMACFDIRGRQVLAACRLAGLAVPDEVAVVGVDNDELLCDLSDPPLTSVAPDTDRTGYLAAQLLDRMMAGQRVPPTAHLVKPLGIIPRLSTDTLAIANAEMATAVRYIRAHACEGINVADVLGQLSMSRRVFEAQFRKLLGRMPHEEIVRTRLARVKDLL